MESEQNNKNILTPKTITFLSDFGLGEECIAVCKGVILSIAPEAKIIDISHLVPPYDVRKGAFVLAQAVKWIEANAHLAIVDPGVGGNRRAVILQTPKGSLIGPDNGILIPASKALGGIEKAAEIKNDEYFLPDVSPTFHGRDIFSPVAAHLLKGAPLHDLGPEIDREKLAPQPWNDPYTQNNSLVLEVIDIDNFGSVRLNYEKDRKIAGIEFKKGQKFYVSFSNQIIKIKSVETYSAASKDELGLLFDSSNHLTIFKNQGSAAEELKLKPGDRLEVKLSPH